MKLFSSFLFPEAFIIYVSFRQNHQCYGNISVYQASFTLITRFLLLTVRNIGHHLRYVYIKTWRGHLTWDEVVRHSTDTKLICALLSPVHLEDMKSLVAHCSLILNEVARFVFWVVNSLLCGILGCLHVSGPSAEVVMTLKDKSYSYSTLSWFVFSLSLNL